MTDYSELVKALRWCSVDEYVPCTGCPMNEETHGTGCFNIMHQRAADAIEALDAKADYWMGQAQEEYEKRLRQMPKRGEWSEENRRPRSSQFVCSVCHRTAYDPQPTRDKAWRKRCRYSYCPNCGAEMEVQDGQ